MATVSGAAAPARKGGAAIAVVYLFVLWFALAARNTPTHVIEEDVHVGH